MWDHERGGTAKVGGKRGWGGKKKKSKYPTSLCSKSQRSPLGGSDAPEKWLFSPFVLDVGPLHSAASNHTTIQPRGESKPLRFYNEEGKQALKKDIKGRTGGQAP